MLRCFNYDIVCQEIPDEVTLAVNISGCPNRCKGCHSPWLWDDVGEPLTGELLRRIVDRYAGAVTCICFMGGDREPDEVERLARAVRSAWPGLKTGWYSGRRAIPETMDRTLFDFIKLGPYIEPLGGLRSENTNQRLYRIIDGTALRIIPSGSRNR